MATLLGSLGETFNSDAVWQIGEALGVGGDEVQKGVDAVGPVLAGSLAKKSATPSGLDAILGALPKDGNAPNLGDMIGALATGGASAPGGSDALSQLFGSGALSSITRGLSQKLGFDVAPLISMAAPIVLGIIGKVMSGQNLAGDGVAKMLQDEQADFVAGASPQTRALVQDTLADADSAQAMADAFSAEELTALRAAPRAAALLVMNASKSGVMGRMNEGGAAGRAMDGAVAAAAPRSLLVVAYAGGKDDTIAENSSRDELLAMIQSAATLVKSKAPAQTKEFGDFVHGVAKATAEAAKEGGFLGMGGTRVSPAEQAALDDIAKIFA